MKKEVGDTLINRGSLYQSWDQYDKALQDYKDSLQIQRDANDENYQALCLTNIGQVYLAKGDTDNALTYLQQALQLRQKLNDPQYVAETLGSLGDVYTATGDYDKAIESILKALDISHKSNDVQSAALESHQMGVVRLAQGRFGSAISAMQDAVKNYQAAGNKGRELIDAQTDLAGALVLAGRGNESAKALVDAQDSARDLKNPSVDSAISAIQGDLAFYRGDAKSAKPAYEQALRSATQGKDRNATLEAKLSLARLAIADGRSQSALPDLRAIVQQADAQNHKSLSLRASVELAQALINIKDYTHARQELERSLGRSEKLGSRLETARIHYLLGDAMRLSGDNADAGRQYQQALTLFDALQKEQGAEHLLERSDLHTAYTEATRWVSTLRG
jgi:tetratricopeptide (TPR) repeat protein